MRVIFRIFTTLGAGLLPALLELILGMKNVLPDAEIGVAYSAAIGSLAWIVMPRTVARVLKLPKFVRWVALSALITAIAAVGGLIALSAVTLLQVVPSRS